MSCARPFNGFVETGDFLQVNIFTTIPTSGLVLSGRIETPGGQISLLQDNLDGATVSTFTTKLYPLTQGYITSLCVSNLGGGLADQVCFVSIGMQRGSNGSVPPHTVLAQGYVTNIFTVNWPPVYVRGPATGGGDYKLITKTILSVAAAAFDFTSIPQTFTDLIGVLDARCTEATGTDVAQLTYNGDTGANYSEEQVYVLNNIAAGNSLTDNNFHTGGYITGANATANFVGESEFIVHNYANTAFIKRTHVHSGAYATDNVSTAIVLSITCIWLSTAAINRVTLTAPFFSNFVAGSRCSLYGRT